MIVDLVMNHSSIEHPWFRTRPRRRARTTTGTSWEDENPRWLGPGGQVVWHELDGRWYYGVFWEGMPDLNLRSAEVTAELDRIARFWLEDVGVDGFRIDAAKHLIEDGKDAQVEHARDEGVAGRLEVAGRCGRAGRDDRRRGLGSRDAWRPRTCRRART